MLIKFSKPRLLVGLIVLRVGLAVFSDPSGSGFVNSAIEVLQKFQDESSGRVQEISRTDPAVQPQVTPLQKENPQNGMLYVCLKHEPAKKGSIIGVTAEGKFMVRLNDSGEIIAVFQSEIGLSA